VKAEDRPEIEEDEIYSLDLVGMSVIVKVQIYFLLDVSAPYFVVLHFVDFTISVTEVKPLCEQGKKHISIYIVTV
jgi:hypothetical protein